MYFEVKLLQVPPIDLLTGWEVFALMASARHVAGDFWIFEGDVESLDIPEVHVIAEDVTEGHGDMNDQELRNHCEDIFNIQLSSAPPSWKMLADRRRKKP